MIGDQIDSFLEELISLTGKGIKEWIPLNVCSEGKKIGELISDSARWDKNYVVDALNSYVYYVDKGFVALISAIYGNAKVFSPTYDKIMLVACICPGTEVEILSDYGNYGEKINDLFQCILEHDRLTMPDALYEFLEKAVRIDGDDISR